MRGRLLLSAVVLIGLAALAAIYFTRYSPIGLASLSARAGSPKTVEDRLAGFGAAAEARWRPYFSKADVPYPPRETSLIGIKSKRLLEVYAAGSDGAFHFIRAIPILAASGHSGPKLREGDGQVPEGLYQMESLNPNSLFHVSLRVNYPNDFDRARAREEGRTALGGDIMIHGSSVSVGCLAMGDEAAEDLFSLAALTKSRKMKVILTPVDFRSSQMPPSGKTLPWVEGLYAEIARELRQYSRPE
jgi:hypothetical protein